MPRRSISDLEGARDQIEALIRRKLDEGRRATIDETLAAFRRTGGTISNQLGRQIVRDVGRQIESEFIGQVRRVFNTRIALDVLDPRVFQISLNRALRTVARRNPAVEIDTVFDVRVSGGYRVRGFRGERSFQDLRFRVSSNFVGPDVASVMRKIQRNAKAQLEAVLSRQEMEDRDQVVGEVNIYGNSGRLPVVLSNVEYDIVRVTQGSRRTGRSVVTLEI